MFGLITKKSLGIKLAAYESMLQKALTFSGVQTIGGYPVYGMNTAIEGTEKYCTVDDLYSIVKRITKTCKRIPLYVYAVKDGKKFGQYKVLSRQWEKSRKGWDNLLELKDASMEIIGEQDELQRLLDNPNELNSKDEFMEACYAFMLLSGNRYIWKEMITGGANNGKPLHLYNLPPNYMTLKIEQGFPAQIKGYELTLSGIKGFMPEEVIHSRYFNPRYDITGSELIGLSPVQAMNKTITQSSAERDYTNQSLQNAGAKGILVATEPQSLPGGKEKSVETLGKMKADLIRNIGPVWVGDSNRNAGNLGMLSGGWQYIPLGLSPADMEIIAQNKVTFQKMCNVLGVSDILFNNDTAATESNVKEMVKQLYTNAVLPEVHSLRDALNKDLTPLFKDKKRHIDYDITDISELQEDTASIVTRFANAPAFRVDDMMEALGYGKTGQPGADVILVKQGYAPLEDIAMSIQDIPLTGDYANG